jgi:hypothetical protein
MAYGVWGGEGEEDRELEYRESEDDEVGRFIMGRAAGPPAAGPAAEFLGGNGAGEKQPRIYSNNFLFAPASSSDDELLSSTSSAISNNSNAAETQDKDPRARVCVYNRVSSGCFLR